MKERPIPFSADMVRAILDGRKTQTRRVVKLDLSNEFDLERDGSLEIMTYEDADGYTANILDACPYGKASDQLWVKEALCKGKWEGMDSAAYYQAGNMPVWDMTKPCEYPAHWTRDKQPPMFCPRSFSRIQLEIVNVRVERLQDISEDDAKAEGVQPWKGVPGDGERSAAQMFVKLWDSINDKRGYSWDSNPWVWVVEFELMEATQ